MHFKDLQTFITVAEQGSFSRAATLLNVTQPAISKRISSLESHFGAAVFDRIGKRVHLTHAGTLLLPQAHELLRTLAATEQEIIGLQEQVAGTLYLATSHHIGLHRLAPVLKRFTSEYPDVQLNIEFEDSEVAHDMVRRGEVDLAVVTLNPKGDTTLTSREIWSDPLVFVADQPIAVQNLADLAALPCVLPGTGTYTGRIVLERFAAQGITLTPTMSTNYLETIGMMVSVGLGWSVLPRSMAAALTQLEIDAPAMSRNLGYVINPSRTTSRAAAEFLATLNGVADKS
ncbi:MAG: LysR family transcriptional regulator [Pseudomonadota bacterium]